MARNILLFVTFLVASGCFLIIFAVDSERYGAQMDAESVSAEVVEVGDGYVAVRVGDELSPRYADMPSGAATVEVGESALWLEAGTYSTIAKAVRPVSAWPLQVAFGFLLLGSSFLIVPIVDRRRLAAAGNDPEAILREMHRKRRCRIAIVGLVITGTTALMVAAAFLDPSATTGLIGGALAIAALPGFFAIKQFHIAFGMRDLDQAELAVILRERPGDVVWIYEHTMQTRGVALSRVSTVMVGLADGRRLPINVGQVGADVAMVALQRLAANAVVGYSPEVEQDFKSNPTALAA